jgi:hypothetical protein
MEMEKTYPAVERMLKPLLKELSPGDRRVARLVCMRYTFPNLLDEDPELSADLNRERKEAAEARKALHLLRKRMRRLRQELIKANGGTLKSLPDRVRRSHIPRGSAMLLYVPKGESPAKAHFRKKKKWDPAVWIEDFLRRLPGVIKLAEREWRHLAKYKKQIRPRWKENREAFLRYGGFEYSLWEIFLKDKVLRRNRIEERIAEIKNVLGGAWRPNEDGRRGNPAVRRTIGRVKKNREQKNRFDRYLKRHGFIS